LLCHISKILKNESNSQHCRYFCSSFVSCVISQRYSKMKAIHNDAHVWLVNTIVVSYLKDTQKWKQFTTIWLTEFTALKLCHISKILKNESNSQPIFIVMPFGSCCVISQRYSKMKAIHNGRSGKLPFRRVVSYLKDTQKWKQFTTRQSIADAIIELCHISKILKNESNSQPVILISNTEMSCVISQRYSKMKAIHN